MGTNTRIPNPLRCSVTLCLSTCRPRWWGNGSRLLRSRGVLSPAHQRLRFSTGTLFFKLYCGKCRSSSSQKAVPAEEGDVAQVCVAFLVAAQPEPCFWSPFLRGFFFSVARLFCQLVQCSAGCVCIRSIWGFGLLKKKTWVNLCIIFRGNCVTGKL